MMVLLKDACTCTIPSLTVLRTFLRTREAVFALAINQILKNYFLPAIALRGPLRVRALVRVR